MQIHNTSCLRAFWLKKNKSAQSFIVNFTEVEEENDKVFDSENFFRNIWIIIPDDTVRLKRFVKNEFTEADMKLIA